MKYLIYTRDELDARISIHLSSEISRYDIRADIVAFNDRSHTIKALKNGDFDLLIEIGAKAENAFNKQAKNNGIKRCFLYQSIKSHKQHYSATIDLILGDIPDNSPSIKYLGNTLFDAIKPFRNSDTADETQTLVAFVTGYGTSNSVNRQFNGLNNERKDIKLVKANLAHDFENAIQLIQKSNAAIVSSNISELIALQLNCPSVRVNHHGIFKKDNFSLINHLAGKESISVFGQSQKGMIKDSLIRILHDPNHCAGLLQDYQEVKNLLGTEPATRKIARYIIDWLEED